MKRRIAIWASLGFIVACCWVLYTFVTTPEQLIASLREPLVEAVAFVSLPVVFALRSFPLHFWWVPPINAATYAVIGLIVEVLRRKLHPRLAA
jgi:alpha-D-ribose 1-methylphosphonate 5-phosphate C-P lyase